MEEDARTKSNQILAIAQDLLVEVGYRAVSRRLVRLRVTVGSERTATSPL
jgi:hypothetical protein